MTANSIATRSSAAASKSSLRTSIALVALFVGLLAISAWVRVPVGPVPVTLQTLVVFLAAVVLGSKRGAIAVASYIALGFAGLPMFSGFVGGSAAILGATGGYLVGFILSSVVTGAIVQKFGKSVAVLAVAMVAGLAICYAFGTVWFMAISGAEASYVMSVCVLPFVLPDAIKIALAISAVKLIGAVRH